MLNNVEWNRPPRDIFSLDSLIDWLRTKSGSYYYGSVCDCLLAQYFTAMGLDAVIVSHDLVTWGGAERRQYKELPGGWNKLAGIDYYFLRCAPLHPEWTFEKALQRALALRGNKMVEEIKEVAATVSQQNIDALKRPLLRRLLAACSL